MVLTEKWIVRVLASGGWEGRFITGSLTVRVLASWGGGHPWVNSNLERLPVRG